MIENLIIYAVLFAAVIFILKKFVIKKNNQCGSSDKNCGC